MAEIKSFPNNQSTYVGAEWVMRWLHGRTSGVFAANGNAAVSAVQGAMQVAVSDGIGWISNAEGNGVVWWNDTYKTTGTNLTLDVSIADGALDRIDRVIVEWETTNYVALPQIKVLTGTASATPTAPTLTNNNVLRQISLAKLTIPAGAVSVTASMITDERMDDTVCGIVTESIEIDTSMVQAQMSELLDTIEEELREINDGSGVVLSVNGKGGVVTIDAEDVGAVASVNGKTGQNITLDVDDVGAMPKWELLWTNSSPSNQFSAQTVSLDLSEYDAVAILHHRTGSQSHNAYQYSVDILMKGYTGMLRSGGYAQIYRAVTVSDSGCAFTQGYYAGTYNGTPSSDNSVGVPVKIYVIKGIQSV